MKFASSVVLVGIFVGAGAIAQETPSPALLVLHKGENAMAIVDPSNGKVVGRVPVGQDPHELAVSDDGKLAFASNYSGNSTGGGQLPVGDRHRGTKRAAPRGAQPARSPSRIVVRRRQALLHGRGEHGHRPL